MQISVELPYVRLTGVVAVALATLFVAASSRAGEAEAQTAYKKGDYRTTIENLRPLAERGDQNSQIQLGMMLAEGKGVSQDDAQAVVWFRKAAEQGNPIAQCNLGYMYDAGRGVPQDDVQALSWYRKAAMQGDPTGEYQVALMSTNGQGTAQSYAAAVQWYRKAADQGMADAQHNLAHMYLNGLGVQKDSRKAAELFRKAAEQGLADSQSTLGWMYENGNGVTRDYVEAITWYRKAATQGNAAAQNNLGVMYFTGQGVAKNLAEAKKWFQMAADRGNVDAKDSLSRFPSLDTISEDKSARHKRPAGARMQTVIAKGISVVPGAVICADMDTVSFMFDWYTDHWSEALQDQVTHGQSRLLHGAPRSAPEPERYGCTLVAAGTPMVLTTGNIVPVVTVRLPNGDLFTGVTFPTMVIGN